MNTEIQLYKKYDYIILEADANFPYYFHHNDIIEQYKDYNILSITVIQDNSDEDEDDGDLKNSHYENGILKKIYGTKEDYDYVNSVVQLKNCFVCKNINVLSAIQLCTLIYNPKFEKVVPYIENISLHDNVLIIKSKMYK